MINGAQRPELARSCQPQTPTQHVPIGDEKDASESCVQRSTPARRFTLLNTTG
jgi:hypothetical protein